MLLPRFADIFRIFVKDDKISRTADALISQ